MDDEDCPQSPPKSDAIPPGYEIDAAGQPIRIPELSPTRNDVSLATSRVAQLHFLDTYARTGRWIAACRATGCSTTAAHNLRKDNEWFRESCEAAEATYAGIVRAEIQRRALHGVDEPVYQKGQLIGYKRVYSDQLLIIEARRTDPEVRAALAPTPGPKVTVNTTAIAGASVGQLPPVNVHSLGREGRAHLRALLSSGSGPALPTEQSGAGSGLPAPEPGSGAQDEPQRVLDAEVAWVPEPGDPGEDA